jgi:hypothetical protein
MSSSKLTLFGAPGALLAAVAWMASGIIDLLTTNFTSIEGVLLAVALLGTLGGLKGLHARQAKRCGWLGTTGFLVAFIGSTFLLICLALFLFGGAVVLELTSISLIGVSFLTTFIGYLLLGLATLRVKLFPRWCGLLLIIGLPVAITLQESGGGVALGVMWFGLSYVLLQEDDLSALL